MQIRLWFIQTTGFTFHLYIHSHKGCSLGLYSICPYISPLSLSPVYVFMYSQLLLLCQDCWLFDLLCDTQGPQSSSLCCPPPPLTGISLRPTKPHRVDVSIRAGQHVGCIIHTCLQSRATVRMWRMGLSPTSSDEGAGYAPSADPAVVSSNKRSIKSI